MARKKKRVPETFESCGKSNEHFTALYDSMIESAAYKSLSSSARTVYTVIKSKYRGDFTGNEITCPYAVFEEYGLQHTTVKRALDDLENAGFIEVERQGFTTKNLHREPNIYRLSSRWSKGNSP